MQAIWPDTVVEENRLNQVISALRKALGEKPGEHRFILTEAGRGYRFVAEVQELSQAPEPAQADTEAEAITPTLPRRGMRIFLFLLVLAAAAVIAYLYLNNPRPMQKQATTSTPPAVAPEQAVKVTPPPSVAVLPFVNMSPDKDQEYFADGVADEVLNQLSRIRDLFVIGRQSSFSFKGKHEDLRVIGEKLGVAYLLEGSVRKEGQRVRITAQLVKAADGHNLWSRSYDRDLEDIFGIQGDIAQSVADALQITLGVGELGRDPGMTRNIAAYDAFLNGWSMYQRLGRNNISRCIEQLEKATVLDPEFARAWSVLAGAYGYAATDYFPDRVDEYLPMSEAAARRAIAIAPGSVEAYFADERLQARSGNWSAQEIDVKNILKLAPFKGYTYANYGGFLVQMGRPHDAIEYLQRATRTEPLISNYASILGTAYEFSGNYKAGLKENERGKGLAGDHTFINFNIVAIYMETGDRGMLDTVLKNRINDGLFPTDNRLLTGLMHTVLKSPEQGRSELYRLYKDPKYNQTPTRVAMAHLASYIREPQLALKIYNELNEAGKLPVIVLWRPLHKEMRRLPGFKDLVTKLGLVDYWRATGTWNEFCHPVGEDDFECN